MIAYLVTRGARYTIDTFLDTWGRELRGSFRVLPYEEAFAGTEIAAATLVFSDLERLSDAERSAADELWRELAALDPPPRLLNRPTAVLPRAAFLEELQRVGINDFRVAPLRRARTELQLPLFVRHRDDHWADPELVHDRRALEREIARTFLIRRIDDRLAVEFCDTQSDDGLFRKYAAFVVDGRIVPRHLVFDRHWHIKMPQLIDEAKLEEEARYLEGNPHAEQLLAAAAIGGCEYGRIDYGVKDGRIRVWEINTNPMVMLHPSEYDERHLPAQRWFQQRIAAELARLADGPAPRLAWAGAPALARPAPPATGHATRLARAAATHGGRAVARVGARLWSRRLAELAERSS